MKIGIDIGGSHIGVGIFNSNSNLILKKEKDISLKKEANVQSALKENIIQLVNMSLEECEYQIDDIEFIGISSPGIVNSTTIIKADNLNIKNYNIVLDLQSYFRVPIILKNDAKCAALAEKQYGYMKKYKDAVFVNIGTGIGGAVFMNDKMLKPIKTSGFEFGHMIICKDGKQCSCGKLGCFEAYASMKVLKDNIRKELNRYDLRGKQIKEMLENKENDSILNPIVNEYIEYLAIGILNIIEMFEPQIIAIGGSFSHYENVVIDKLNNRLEQMRDNKNVPKIVTAKLKNDAGILGAILEE